MDNLVTIAIASYNNAQYIERCVDSVISQTYKSLEILIVDDGSTDDTLKRLEKYHDDNRVRIIAKENEGLSSVRQRSLDEALGDYISFIDADDYIDINYAETMYRKLQKDEADVCVCSTRFEDWNGMYLNKESDILSCEESSGRISFSINNISDPNERFSSQFFLSDSWNKMYRVDFVRNSGVVFNMPKGLNGTDSVFNRRLFLRCPSYTMVTEQLYVHVIYRNSAVHRKNKDLLSTTMHITTQMLTDIKTLRIESQMAKWVSSIYYEGLLSAMVDVYNEYRGSERLDNIRKIYKRHQQYIKEYGIKELQDKDVRSKKIKTFLFTLRYARFFLPTFLSLLLIVKKVI